MENNGYLSRLFSKEAGKGAAIGAAVVVVAAPFTAGISLTVGALLVAAAAGAAVSAIPKNK
jgi:hypothetical protein